MCVTIVGKVLEVNGKKGIVEVDGKQREMDFSLAKIKRGDFVSCALNLAVEKIENEEAISILNARRGLLESKR
ncbi:MAG: HypC/HybG/HupF family hydrogenase formation chaperone [archaeon]|mgnify:CR=1 FL=1